MESNVWYVASPYSGCKWGFEDANSSVTEFTAQLTARGIVAFSPITHGHQLSKYIPDIAKDDHSFWLRTDTAFLSVCRGVVVLQIPGWDTSTGVNYEIDLFCQLGRPIVFHPYLGNVDYTIDAIHALNKRGAVVSRPKMRPARLPA